MRQRRTFRDDARAAAAVEFAFVAPLFILLVFGIIVFGTVISTFNSVQQIAAEAARASLAGMTDSERDQLARSYISNALGYYPLISGSKLAVATAPVANPHAFKVSLTYDMSGMAIFGLGAIVSLPLPTVKRTSVVLVETG